MVSRACASGVSPSATAAATPPCAQALDAASPIGAAVTMVTGRGLSFSAQNRPARPPPTMTTSSVANVSNVRIGLALQVDHPLDRAPRLGGDHRVDRDFLFQVH